MEHLIEVRGLSKHYDSFCLDDINLCVPAGSVVGLIGSNGAGKTTTIKALLGLIEIDGGTVELLGTRLNAATSAELVAIKQRIGVVFDACSFPEEMRVAEVGQLMAHAYPAWKQETFDGYLRRFGIESTKTIKQLSRGMGMKFSLACALAHAPQLLVLDEATAGLDPMAREDVLDILREHLADETHGVLMSSHITSDLDKIADYIVCIDDGRLVFAAEKPSITELAGLARCRAAEFEQLIESGFFAAGTLHYQRREYEVDVLAPDRFAFAEAFPNITMDRMDIEAYMSLMLRGELK